MTSLESGMPEAVTEGDPLAELTVERRVLANRRGRPIGFRLLRGYNGDPDITIFQEYGPEERLPYMGDSIAGYAHGQSFRTKEEAWAHLGRQGYMELVQTG